MHNVTFFKLKNRIYTSTTSETQFYTDSLLHNIDVKERQQHSDKTELRGSL